MDGGADGDEAEEFGRDVFVHSDAAVSARVVFDPSGVESVGWFELAPIGHRSSFERPAGGALCEECLFHLVAVVGVAVGVGAAFRLLVEDPECAGGSGAGRGADRDGHGQQYFGAFHDVCALAAERDFDADVGWIFREFGGQVVGLICGEAAIAALGGGARGQHEGGCGEGKDAEKGADGHEF